MFINNSISRQ